MKRRHSAKQITLRGCWVAVVLSIFSCNLNSARAQSPDECTEQVLSAPTESSVRVRLTGVTEWPVNPICFWTATRSVCSA
jgi:hypothetical protein